MRTYIINLTVPSGFATPWHSDTIFGHLCWTAEHYDGFKNFCGASELINLFRNNEPPFVLSDGFPKGLLPSPVILKNLYRQLSLDDLDVEQYVILKRAKKRTYLTHAQFQTFQNGGVPDIYDDPKGLLLMTTMHNRINRFNNTTGDQGSLFEREEWYAPEGSIQIFIKFRNGFEDDVQMLFEKLSQDGYGAKKSTGKGAFTLISIQTFDGFDLPDDKKDKINAFTTLSHYVPSLSDPTEGAYKMMVKYGKLGDEKALCGQPFKKPFIILKPGAVFRASNIKPFYGRLVEDIAYADKSIVQYGYAFTVPIVQYS